MFSPSFFLKAALIHLLRVLKPSLILPVARVYKHNIIGCLGAETDPKMPRPKVPSEGKGPTASQDEFRATADSMTELLTTVTQKFDEINKHLVETKTSASMTCVRSGSPAIISLASPQVEDQGILRLEIKWHNRARGNIYHDLSYRRSNLRSGTQERVWKRGVYNLLLCYT